MLKLKLQYFGHLMRRADSLEKTDAGRVWEQEEKGTIEDEMADGITDSMDMNLFSIKNGHSSILALTLLSTSSSPLLRGCLRSKAFSRSRIS